MLNKTCMEALQILEKEIDLAYDMFLETAKKARAVNRRDIRCKIKQKADKWQCRYAALLKVHSRFLKEIEP